MRPRGIYLLALRLRSQKKARIASLGILTLEPGYYIYAGSARGKSSNLLTRVCRHYRLWLAKQGKLHWHVDYLLVLREIDFREVLALEGASSLRECWVFWRLIDEGIISEKQIIPNFGNSDCSCKGHLLYLKEEKDYKKFREAALALGYRSLDPRNLCER